MQYLLGTLSNSSSCSPSPLINTPNIYGNRPLHYAALNGHLDTVKVLVAAGADISLKNEVGRDAVFEAENGEKLDVVEWLLNQIKKAGDGEGMGSVEEKLEEDLEGEGEVEVGLREEIQSMDINKNL